MRIQIFGIKNQREIKKYRAIAKKIINIFGKSLPNNASLLNIIFVNNNYIKKLNKKYLGRNRPTDVLAFPLWRTGQKLIKEEVWAEIYISKNRAQMQAKELKITQKEEIANLIKHGILHLLGFSHQKMKTNKA